MGDFGRDKAAIFILLIIFFLKGVVLASLVPCWQSPSEFFEAAYGHIMAEKKAAPNTQDIIPSSFQTAYKKAFFPGQPLDLIAVPGLPKIGSSLYYIGLAVFATIGKRFGFSIELFFLRLFSVLLGIGVVWISYTLSKLIFPNISLMAVAVPFLVVFHPQYSLISSRVGIINYYAFTFALLLYLLTKVSLNFSRGATLAVGAILILGVPPEHRLLVAVPVIGWLVFLFMFGFDVSKAFKFLTERLAVVFLLFLTVLFGWLVIQDVLRNLFHIYLPASPLALFDQNIAFFQIKSRFWGLSNAGVIWNNFPNGAFFFTLLNFLTNIALIGFLIWFLMYLFQRRVVKITMPSAAEAGPFVVFTAGLVLTMVYPNATGLYSQAVSFLKWFSIFGLMISLFAYLRNRFDLDISALFQEDQCVIPALLFFSFYLLFGLGVIPPQTLETGSYVLIALIPVFVLFSLGMFQLTPWRWRVLELIALFVFLAGLDILIMLSVVVLKYYQTLDQFISGAAGTRPLMPVWLVILFFIGFLVTCLAYLNELLQIDVVAVEEKESSSED